MSWRIPTAQIIHDSDFTFPAWDENDFQADPTLRGRAAITWKAAIRLIVCLNGLERIFYQWRAGKLQLHRATLAAIIEQFVNAAETNIRVLCALRPSAPPFDLQDPESIIKCLPSELLQNFNQRSWERWGDSTDPNSYAQKCLKLWEATAKLKRELKRSPAIALKTAFTAEIEATRASITLAAREGDSIKPCESDKPKRRMPLEEAEVKVREELQKQVKENPSKITRDAIAKAIGASAGTVSNTAAWKVYSEYRNADKKPAPREVPLTDRMQAVLPAKFYESDELA